MDDAARVRADVAIGVNVRHDVVPHALLMPAGVVIVDVVDVLLHLIDLCLGDVQPQLFLGLGQRDPQPAPCGKFMIGRKEEKHFPAGIAAAQRRFIAVLAHDDLLYTHK